MKEDFTSIGEILANTLDDNPRYKYALKCSTIFSFWEEIVGKRFVNITKPITITSSKLKVLCKNSTVAQELSMFKIKLLEKIKVYAEPLGVEISDMMFSYKDWTNAIQKFEEIKEEIISEYSDNEINSQELTKEETEKIFEIIEKLDFMPNEIKEKYFSDIIKNLKYQKLTNLNT